MANNSNTDLEDRLEEQRQQAKAWMDKEASQKEEKLKKEEENSAKKRVKFLNAKPIKISLMKKMMFFSLAPLLIMGLVVTIYTIITLKTSLRQEKINSLTNFAICVKGSIENTASGEINLKDDIIYVGDTPLSDDESFLDTFSNQGAIELSLYYGNEMYSTTILDNSKNKIKNLSLSEDIIKSLYTDVKMYSSDKDLINGEKYYSVYIPLKSGGKAVAALSVSQPCYDVDSLVNGQVLSLAIIAIFILLASAVIVGFNSFSIASAIKKMEASLTALADGYLSITINMSALRRNDEIGTMARALQNTAKRMTDIVHETNSIIRRLVKAGDNLEESSEQSSVSAVGINQAIGEIAKGAVSQASDVDKASLSVTQMGEGINSIVESLSSLKNSTEIMMEADRKSEEIILELFESGKQTSIALDEVSHKVNETDKAVAKIQEAVSIITNIADETSLLSLNASIEAARAGEAGRGFAVVAIQIQKLAEESSHSADRIREAIEELSADSQASVRVMTQMSQIILEQQEKLETTRKQFESVSNGINATIDETKIIYGQSQNCARERENVLEIIQNLSLVSEGNASSTESTTSAMSDLNETINLVADSAKNLQKIALSLKETVKFFKL